MVKYCEKKYLELSKKGVDKFNSNCYNIKHQVVRPLGHQVICAQQEVRIRVKFNVRSKLSQNLGKWEHCRENCVKVKN